MRWSTGLGVVVSLVACFGKSKAPSPPSSGSAAGSAVPITSPYPTKPAGPAVAPVSSAPGVKVTLADVGLETASLDRTTDPCVDFYQFACGGWLANHAIPPDRTRWGRFHEIDERNKTAIKALLEEAAKGISADATTKKLGDFYASCMDEATIDRAGTAPLKPLLDKASKAGTAKGWAGAIGALHERGIWVVWNADAYADLKDADTHVMYLDAGKHGIAREVLVDPDQKPVLDTYKAHVAKLLALAGVPLARADAAAADVLAIELELAKLGRSAAERADETALYAAVDPKALAKQTRSIDWKAYWRALGVAPETKLVVKSPKLFAQLDRVRAKFKPQAWASYFTYHAVRALALALPRPFLDQVAELERATTGVEKAPERSRRCIDATERALGDLVARQYVTKYVPGKSRQTATMLADAITAAIADEITRVDWMSEPTRKAALAKLQKVVRLIGNPDKWQSYELEVKRDDFAGNVLRASAAGVTRRLGRWGKPVDRADWQLDAFSISPYYDHRSNSAALPAGVLQPPFFGPDRAIATNLGGIGILFGRELTKGFDDSGGQFDDIGNLGPWWSKDDLAKFDARAKCVVDQYAQFEALPKGFVDGKRTLSENIADLGGVKLAFKAYRALRKDAAKVYVADGFTEDQQFFIAVGQAWCTRDRPAELATRLASDPFAPPKFRVYGSLRNTREFAEAFSCAPGTPMNPAKTCSVW